ncbi:MAG: bifunctional helix-turn-helix transcriptional regulator/GNAT family N-acetyltransferase [Casimicrobium sp.]
MKTATVPQEDILSVRHFNRFYTQAIGVLKRGLLDSEYTLTEVRVLYELAHASTDAPLTASVLCELLDLDASYCSRLLRNFEAKGLLARAPSRTDARAMQLKLTAKGKRAFAPLERASNAEIAAMLTKVLANDRGNVLASMRLIEAALVGVRGSISSPRAGLVLPPTSTVITRRNNPLSRPSGTLPHEGGGDASRAYRLRAHRPGDMGWVISRHGALYAAEYGWDQTFEALVADICAKFINEFDPTRERCWIAEDDAGPLGCVFVVKKNATTAKLRMLLVEPRARGMKLGARLVDEAIDFARATGYKKMTLWTNGILHAARHIYVARGFKLVKEETHQSFGKDLVGQHWDLKL